MIAYCGEQTLKIVPVISDLGSVSSSLSMKAAGPLTCFLLIEFSKVDQIYIITCVCVCVCVCVCIA